MLLHTVDRNEREKDRGLLYVCLILRVASVGSVLADFKSAGSAEHNIYDTYISYCRNDPLPYSTACSETHNEGSCPYDKLAKIIRTAYQSIHSGINKSVLVYLLCSLFLCICNAFENEPTAIRTAPIQVHTSFTGAPDALFARKNATGLTWPT